MLLTDAALGTYRRFIPGMAGVKLGLGLARRPRVGVAPWLGDWRLSSAGSWSGTSQVQPSPRDRRFADPAWSENPLLRRLAQAYIATSTTAEALVDDAELDWSSAQRMEFLTENLIEALSPSNSPLTNPQALKAGVDTAGLNFLRGAAHFISDMSASPRIPSMVDSSPYRVGENIATSPGAVVLRTEVFELIQYTPADPDGAERAAARHPADDQQVLRHGPGAGPQHGRVPCPARACRSSWCPGATRMPGTATGGSTPTPGRSWTPSTASSG